MTNDELRNTIYFILDRFRLNYLKTHPIKGFRIERSILKTINRRSEATSIIRHYSFVNRHSEVIRHS